jgi:hypothetical protein
MVASKRRILVGVLVVAVLGVAGFFVWNNVLWYTVCTASSPDGMHTATVRCFWVPTLADHRYHYYLTFDPPVSFRPEEIGSTLKAGASAVNNDRVKHNWATRHYMGYLPGFDNMEERQPEAIEWGQDEITVKSRQGIAGRYRIKP